LEPVFHQNGLAALVAEQFSGAMDFCFGVMRFRFTGCLKANEPSGRVDGRNSARKTPAAIIVVATLFLKALALFCVCHMIPGGCYANITLVYI
jgi:hypothetical protein